MTTVLQNVLRDHKDTGNSGTYATTFKTAIPVGQTVVVVVNAPVGTAITGWAAADAKNNTWGAPKATQNPTPVNMQMAAFVCKLTTAIAVGDSFTITMTGANPAKVVVLAIAVDDATGFDKANVSAGSGTGMSIATDVGSQDDQMVIVAWGYTDNTGAVTYTPTDGSTALADETSSPSSAARSLGLQYKVVSGSGTRSSGATLSDPNGWNGIAILLNMPVAGAPNYVLIMSHPANTSAPSTRQYTVDASTSTGTPTLTQTSGTAVSITQSPSKVFHFDDPGGTDDLVFELTAGTGKRTIIIPRNAASKPATISFYGGVVGNINNWG